MKGTLSTQRVLQAKPNYSETKKIKNSTEKVTCFFGDTRKIIIATFYSFPNGKLSYPFFISECVFH